MQLTVDELIHFTDEERAKWERWYSLHGNGPLKLRLAGGTHTTVGALMMHIFRPERRYVQRMRGELLTESKDFPTNTWEEIFAFGRQTREGLRQFVDEANPEDWGRMHQFIFQPNAHQQSHIRATTRKIIVHVLMHEIRHWAQIARVVREHGMAPPGDHDLLLSHALE
jgi:uncharacterized damage-inducible protein DinB